MGEIPRKPDNVVPLFSDKEKPNRSRELVQRATKLADRLTFASGNIVPRPLNRNAYLFAPPIRVSKGEVVFVRIRQLASNNYDLIDQGENEIHYKTSVGDSNNFEPTTVFGFSTKSTDPTITFRIAPGGPTQTLKGTYDEIQTRIFDDLLTELEWRLGPDGGGDLSA